MQEQGPVRDGHATPTCPAIIATLSLASLADKAARTAAARLWPAAGGRARRQESRRCRRRCGPQQGQGRGIPDAVSGSPPRISQFRCRFPRSSSLVAVAVIIVRPCTFLLQAAACRLFHAFKRRLRTSYGYSHLAARSCGSGQAWAADLIEPVQVNVRIRGHGQEMKD